MIDIGLNLLMITAIICYITDLSGIVDSIKQLISRYLLKIKTSDFSLKPLDCSLCMSWWCGLFYICYSGNISITSVALVALFSFLSSHITLLLVAFKDLLGAYINKLNNYIDEIE